MKSCTQKGSCLIRRPWVGRAGENVGITRVCEQDELVLCWRGEKHEASLVPGCMSDTSKVQEAIGALLNTDEVLLTDQAQM